MPRIRLLITRYAKAFRDRASTASRKVQCRIFAIYRRTISARIKLDKAAKYPTLGYDLQGKIKAIASLVLA